MTSRSAPRASKAAAGEEGIVPIGAAAPVPPALITYAGSEPLLASPFCAHVLSSIATQFPLAKIPAPVVARSPPGPASMGVWQPGPAPTELPPLNIELVELGAHLARVQAEQDAFISPSHALSFPLVHLYLLVCDDTEHYRTAVRGDINRWHNVLRHTHGLKLQPAEIPHNGLRPSAPANATAAAAAAAATAAAAEVDAATPLTEQEEPEWLIVLIAPADTGHQDASASGAKRLYSGFQKGSVADKLKSDFGAGHVVQLTRLPPLFPPAAMGRPGTGVDPGMFADLTAALRSNCAASLGMMVQAQEGSLARAEAVHNTLLLHASGDGLDRYGARKMWDFSSWMLAKDYLGRTLEALGMLDDAYLSFSDIDLTILEGSSDLPSGGGAAHPFFFALGGLRQGEDTEPIIDPRRRPYREMLQRERMTLFDARVFVYAARTRILAQLGGSALVRLLMDTDSFLPGLVRSLTARQTMPRAYVASWQYSSALDVVKHASQWWEEHDGKRSTRPPPPRSVAADLDRALGRDSQPATPVEPDGAITSAFSAAKAILLGRARAQLETLGVESGFLPALAPFSPVGVWAFANSNGESQVVYDDLDHKIEPSNADILAVLKGEQAFDLRYSSAVETEMAAWMQARKTSGLMSLRYRVGSLAFLRRRYGEALETFAALADSYAEEGMTRLVEEMLVIWLTAYDAFVDAGEEPEGDWVAMAVRLLNARSLLPNRSRGRESSNSIAPTSPWRTDDHLWEKLRAVEPPGEAGEHHVINGFAAFVPRAATDAALTCDKEDGALLPASVVARIATEVQVDAIKLRMRNSHRPAVWFTSDAPSNSGTVVLHPGQNHVDLFAPAPPTGRYVVDRAQIIVGPFAFEYALPIGTLDTVAGPTLAVGQVGGEPAQLVNIPEDGDALYATLSLPEDIVLDAQRMVEITLHAGRNYVETAEIALLKLNGESVPIPDARLAGEAALDEDAPSAQVTEVGETRLTAVDNAPRVQVHDLTARTVARVLVPLDPILDTIPAQGGAGIVHLILQVDYVTRERPGVSRILRRRSDLRTALPIGVSVQDFFLLTNLFSKFAVLAGGNDALRVRSAELESPNGRLNITAPDKDTPTVVTPSQPASFAFRLEPVGAPVGSDKVDGGVSLKLTLFFRSMAEEARLTTLTHLEQRMAEADPAGKLLSPARRTCLRRALGRLVEDRLDASRYALTGEILLGHFSLRAWEVTCDRWGVPPEPTTWNRASASEPPAETKSDPRTEREAILRVVGRALEDAASGASAGDTGTWHRLILTVDPPRTSVVAAVDIKLAPGPAPLLVGVPREAEVTVRTWTGWSGNQLAPPSGEEIATLSPEKGEEDPHWELTYEVLGGYDTWLINGKARGKLPLPKLETGENRVQLHTIPLALIPVKHGALLFPAVGVSVTPKPIMGGDTEHAEQAALASASAALGAPSDQAPTCETWQANGAQRAEVVPRRSRATFWVDLPNGAHWSSQPGTRFVPV